MTTRIGRVRVWSEVERIVAIELGELLGTSLICGTQATTSPIHTSVVPLTMASDLLRIEIGLGVDERTRDHLRELLLGGDESHEAMADALREMANTAAGAIRRAALDDGDCLAIGLPSNDNLFIETLGKRQVWTMSDKSMWLQCVVAASPNQGRAVPARELCEGMVLSKDVVAVEGLVVAEAGIAITDATAQTIVSAVGGTRPIQVCTR
jgi:hypothetical protein